MKFFYNEADACTYAADEILATLRDDLEQMEDERHLYDDGERDEMRRKIEDLEQVQGLIASASELRESLVWAMDCLFRMEAVYPHSNDADQRDRARAVLTNTAGENSHG